MTENEAIKRIRNMAMMCNDYESCTYGHDCTVACLVAAETAIQALEEIRQYRAIGTVEDIKKTLQNMSVLLASYTVNGTADEFKALKEKAEPKEPLLIPTDDTCIYYEYRCPSCNEWLSKENKRVHCRCGQHLDWT